MTQACVSLDEVLAAAAARAASLVPETSGYLALAVADATSRLPYQHDDRAVLLTVDGSVMVPRKGAVAPPPEAARGLRDLLRRLLASSTGTMPGLTSAARPRPEEVDVDRVVTDIEAALIPVNRAAAKRALARLARETLRAKELGKLRKKPSQAPAAAASPPATTAPAAKGGSISRTAVPAAQGGSIPGTTAPAPQGGSLSWTAAPAPQPPSAPPKKQEQTAIRSERAAAAQQAEPAPVEARPVMMAAPAPRFEIAPPAMVTAPIVEVNETPAPRFEIAPPPLVTAPTVSLNEATAPRLEIAPPAVVIAPVLDVMESPAPRVEIAPHGETAHVLVAEMAAPAPTPTPFHVDVEVAIEIDEATSVPALAAPAPAAPAPAAVAPAAPVIAASSDMEPIEPAHEPEADATILDPDAMAVIEATYRPSEDDSPMPAILTPPPAQIAAPEKTADTGDDALTRPWRPVVEVVERAALIHTPTASAGHAVLLSELGGTRADELLDAFQPQDHGDPALAAAASSLRALAGVDLTQPPRAAAPRPHTAETPSYMRVASRAPSRIDDGLEEMSPPPPPRAVPASTTRWPLALFALGVLVLFAAWLYRPTLARDFFGLRTLLAPAPAPQIEAPPRAEPALAAPETPAAAEHPAPASPPRTSGARASGAGDGQHRRRD